MNLAHLAAGCLGLIALSFHTGSAAATTPTDTTQSFDRYSWVTTHNAFSYNGMLPNQSQPIAQQLREGVRGLMLDLHYSNGRVRLCHNVCTSASSMTFADLVNDTLLPFLDADPNAILTLQLDDFTDRRQLRAEFDHMPELVGKTFDPYAWQTDTWPTYDEIVKSGQRILIFTLNRDQSGAFFTRAGGVHIMPSEDFTVENYWSLGTVSLTHDYRCYSRWGENVVPLRRAEIPGKPGWRPLFTMNQFHGVPSASHAEKDNDFAALHERYVAWCRPAAMRKPNYVAVDFHERGDVDAFVEWLGMQPADTSP
ncbi:hypothetical protein [Luteibacter sp. UNCMF366Tsu5.1]|uniref:hypothetical protein n=1 Tax=Luteibacter sp. UNCMF366Tsu5.1 TaxID=1502758 RepID=UPI000908C8D9|nr:hypothetical protein [Luteibacter sp. UNCMF366Tsu5.1]SFW52163.1 hypothetical protein SAMN02800691_1893 [Luteibacter sp. UNCMF366Tsu5.1]